MMPFAKAVIRPFEGSDGNRLTSSVDEVQSSAPHNWKRNDLAVENRLDDVTVTDDLFQRNLVSIGQQLVSLLILSGNLFDELLDEYRLIRDRTDRIRSRISNLSTEVNKLDAKAVHVPVGSVSTAYNAKHQFETDYLFSGLTIFDPGNRPLSVQHLYGSASPTPVSHIKECDCYRTDGVRGAQLFSRTPVVLNKWKDDFVSVEKGKQATVVLPMTVRKIRPPCIDTGVKSLPNLSKVGSGDCEMDDVDDTKSNCPAVSFSSERSSTFADSLPVLMVNIDITGSSFNKLCRLHAPSHKYEIPDFSDGTASLGRRKTILQRPRTITGVSDLLFREIDIDASPLKHSSSTKVKTSQRNPLNKETSKALERYAPKERKTLKDHKKKSKYLEDDESKSCGSWRSSLKSVFRLSRSKSRELCNGYEENVQSHEDKSAFLKRSMSLPRSAKSATKQAMPSFRSSSVEAQLNFRVNQSDGANGLNTVSDSKHVAGERLGRSLTKSLSQVRLGRSSKNKSSLNGQRRPQSMEIRVPSLGDGQAVLSVYNDAFVTSSATHSLPLGNDRYDQQWAKSLSIIKLRSHDDRDLRDDCQSSSGRWSGSSCLTERQLLSESEKQTRALATCSSDTSFGTKDSAMCLNFSPNSFNCPTDRQNSSVNAVKQPFLRLEAFHGEPRSWNDAQETVPDACVMNTVPYRRKKSNDKKHLPSCSNDKDDFPTQNTQVQSQLYRPTKSSAPSAVRNSFRSSFMLRLKKFGKSSKTESSSGSITPTSAGSETRLTMGDFISMDNEEVARSLTPTLPPGESTELQKLADLADRLAAAKAKSSVAPLSPSSLSSSSSKSCVDPQLNNKRGQMLILGEVNQILRRSSSNSLPSPAFDRSDFSPSACLSASDEEFIQAVDKETPGSSMSTLGQGFSFTRNQQVNMVGQKSVELESILEASHEFETARLFPVANEVTATDELCTPLQRYNPDGSTSDNIRKFKTAITIPTAVGDNRTVCTRSKDESEDKSNSETKMLLPLASSPNYPGVPLPLDSSIIDDHLSPLSAVSPDIIPATARLIISSPLANRAFFVDNPHKRSLCQPLSPDDFVKICSGDSEMAESPSSKSLHVVYPEIMPSAKPSLNIFKQSSKFPVTIREKVDPSNYGRSWYDGIAAGDHKPCLFPSSGSSSKDAADSWTDNNVPVAMQKNQSAQTSNSSASQEPENNRRHMVSTSSAFKNETEIKKSAWTDDIGCQGIQQSMSKVILPAVASRRHEKKCARVVFPTGDLIRTPSCDSGVIASPSKQNSFVTRSDGLPNVNLRTFRNDAHAYAGDIETANLTNALHSSFEANGSAMVVKSNTLPRSCTSEKSSMANQLQIKCLQSEQYW